MATPETSTRRGVPPSPSAASRDSAESTSVMTDTSRNPGPGGAPRTSPAATGPRSTSSTMPEPAAPGSPRNTARSESDGASNKVGQSPRNRSSMSTENPRPSRQKRRLSSTSRTQIAEWCTTVTAPPPGLRPAGPGPPAPATRVGTPGGRSLVFDGYLGTYLVVGQGRKETRACGHCGPWRDGRSPYRFRRRAGGHEPGRARRGGRGRIGHRRGVSRPLPRGRGRGGGVGPLPGMRRAAATSPSPSRSTRRPGPPSSGSGPRPR